MEVQRIFEILEIEATKDEAAIREAYRDRLVFVNPEDNPEGFKRLREAYEGALLYARQQEAEQEGSDDPVSLFLNKAKEIYASLSRRLDEKEWEALVREDVLDDLDLCEDAKWGLFSSLARYYRMPAKIWKVLDQAFGIVQNEQEFKEHLNQNFVDFMVWKIQDETGDTDFPYEKFIGEDGADYDAFMEHFDALTNLTGTEAPQDRAAWEKEMAQEVAFLESLHISHPWLAMEKAKVALALGNQEEAQTAVCALWEEDKEDIHILMAGANLLYRCGQEQEAVQAYEKALEQENLSDERCYTASLKLAEYYMKQEDMLKARENALRAIRIYNTQAAGDLLNQINEKLIEVYAGERAEELTEEEGIRLAWCMIQTGRSREGWEFFAAHPVLEADTSECHWAKTIMALESDLAWEGMEQARQWRACILREAAEDAKPDAAFDETMLSDEDQYRMAQTFKLEGKAYQMLYGALEDKDSEEAAQYREAGGRAIEEAVMRQPKEMDFLMAKTLFLREIHEYERMAESCARMKELDDGFFWAYFYAQEAYEELGKAQEVVDAFYDAKNIYAGKPEIYERALRVFLAYRQYKDAKHILDQAQDAGVESFYLSLKKVEVMRRLATDEETLKEADDYAARVIAKLEEQNAPDEDKAEAYLQRCFIQDDGRAEDFQTVDGMEEWAVRAVELADTDRNRYFLGRFYLEYRDDAKKCYEHMKLCEQRGLDFAWMYFYIARCHEEFEQWDEALSYFKRAAEKDPEESDFRWRVVWRLRWKFNETSQLEYCQEALRYLREQNEKFGETPRELWQASDLHAGLREYETALDEITRALEKSPLARNWGQKGFLLDMLKRPEEGYECYQKGIEVELEGGRDYAYGYTRIYEYYCEKKDYEGGVAWFLKTLSQLKTDKQRQKNLDRIKHFYIWQGKYEEALEIIRQIYGGTGLDSYVCDSWEREGERIEDLLDLYENYLSPEELAEKNREAEKLLSGNGPAENVEGRRRAYMQLGFSYANHLLDDENGLIFFQKALKQVLRSGAEMDQSEYRSALEEIMKCRFRLGKTDQMKKHQEMFWRSLEKEYKSCADLGKSTEELYKNAFGNERSHLYHLFIMYYYSNEFERARECVAGMEKSEWCQWCRRADCSEVWECKGMLALLEKNYEEALRLFQHALACAPKGNADVGRELLRLKRLGFA